MNRNKVMIVAGVLLFLIVATMLGFSNGTIFSKNNISEEKAMEIADEYVQSKLSPDEISELEFEETNYIEPYFDGDSGIYEIKYYRIINEIPSLNGVKIRINAETGEVYNYRKSWSIDEDEIALVDTKPSISSNEAAKIITDYMTNEPTIGKEKANTVKTISSELYWKEDDNETVHLAWGITFKDSTFKYDDYPAEAWIDAHSGEMLLFAYARD
ncbi:YcdB/YcdC domain-containing protein [Methanolobus sp. WCC1]|uniref:YcdB/YcdC domain-containing protein n=1 Tax=unclassified Methanolobus TaxID=2629569 RepID=UPI00324FA9FF